MNSNRTTQKKWRAGKTPNFDELLAKVRSQPSKEEQAAKDEIERLKKLPLPEPRTEGKYPAMIVRALVEILTGTPTIATPTQIQMPETIYQPITLVLSSTEQFYYRVTPDSCTCKGWYFSKEKYSVGKCRHHTLAFPEQAVQNNKIIDGLKAAAKPRAVEQVEAKACKPKMVVHNAEDFHDLSKAQLKELGTRIEHKLKGEYAIFDYALVRADNQSITLKYVYKEKHSQAEEAQVQAMIKAAKALTPEGVSVCASCM